MNSQRTLNLCPSSSVKIFSQENIEDHRKASNYDNSIIIFYLSIERIQFLYNSIIIITILNNRGLTQRLNHVMIMQVLVS